MRNFENYDKQLLQYYNSNSLKIPKNITLLNEFLNQVELKLNIKIGSLIGLGFEGQVYEILNSNNVIKFQPIITNDYSDIITNEYLKTVSLKNIANVVSTGIINNNTFNSICLNGLNNEIAYTISEKLIVDDTLKKLLFNMEIEFVDYSKTILNEDPYIKNLDGDNLLGFIEDLYIDDSKSYLKSFIKTSKYKKYLNQLIDILMELDFHTISYNDFVVKNLGFKNKKLALFDINGFEDYLDLKIIKETI
jgi:hypothetical protein